MGSTMQKWLRKSSANDLSELTGLSKREAEVLYYDMQNYSDEEIAEEMGIEVGTVKSFYSKIQKKGDKWKTSLRALIESEIYQPADVVVEFHELSEYDPRDVDRDNLESFLTNVLEEEKDVIQELNDFAYDMKAMAKERRNRLAHLKRRLADHGVFDASGWELMERSERAELLKELIDSYEIAEDEPAPHQYIVDTLKAETGATEDEIQKAIDRLMMRGEMYEPQQDHYYIT